jgi:hypothetical protein
MKMPQQQCAKRNLNNFLFENIEHEKLAKNSEGVKNAD